MISTQFDFSDTASENAHAHSRIWNVSAALHIQSATLGFVQCFNAFNVLCICHLLVMSTRANACPRSTSARPHLETCKLTVGFKMMVIPYASKSSVVVQGPLRFCCSRIAIVQIFQMGWRWNVQIKLPWLIHTWSNVYALWLAVRMITRSKVLLKPSNYMYICFFPLGANSKG